MSVTKQKETYVLNEQAKLIVHLNDYGFSSDKVQHYEEKFNELTSNNIIIGGEFKEQVWKLENDGFSINLKFAYESRKELNLALKCFAINELTQKKTVTVYNCLRYINHCLGQSSIFNDDNYDRFVEYIESKQPQVRYDIAASVLNFLDFYEELEVPNDYYDFLESIPSRQSGVRDLPDYQSILEFDYVLEDYISKYPEEKLKYFPILIWWKLTKILPLRPLEFLRIKQDCLSEENGAFYITVPRKKLKYTYNSLKVEDKIRISKGMFDLLNEYQSLLGEKHKTKYFISYHAFNSFIRGGSSAYYTKVDSERMERINFVNILNEFYDKIVVDKYNINVKRRLKMGDTRHLAFCNMMFQGFNMLSIARMGGHAHLNSQIHYSGHLDTFAESRVKLLAQQLYYKRQEESKTIFPETEALIVRSKLSSSNKDKIEIEGGYCSDKAFPSNCMENCFFCSFFEVDLKDNPEMIIRLRTLSADLNNSIQTQIKTMRKISTEMFYDIKNLSYSETEQERLNSLSQKIKGLIDRKSVIDSYILEVDNND